MSRRPCCCIPNRGATVTLSLLSIIVSTMFLVGSFIVISTNALNTQLIVPFVIWGFACLMLFISSWVGFLGAILRKNNAVSFYAIILMILWVATLIIGLWNTVAIFRNRQGVIDSCVAKGYAQARGGPFDSTTSKNNCTHAHNVLSGIFLTFWLIYQMMSLWFILTVFALHRELLDRAADEKAAVESTYSRGHSRSSSINSDDDKRSMRSNTVVSVPYRPAGPTRNAPMGGYVSSSGVPVGGGATSGGNNGQAAVAAAGGLSRSSPRAVTDADRGTTANSGRKSPPTALQINRAAIGPPSLNVTVEQDADWNHEPTPMSSYHEAPLSVQPASIFQSRYDQRYG